MTQIANPEDLSAEQRRRLADWLVAMSDSKHLLGSEILRPCDLAHDATSSSLTSGSSAITGIRSSRRTTTISTQFSSS